jgi:hypothetical protein
MIKTISLFIVSFTFLAGLTKAQVNCNTVDLNKITGKWIWQSKAPSFQDPIPGSQWNYCDPIRKELQRIMPKAPDGIIATNSIAFPKGKAFWHSPSPNSYENYLMIKDYECLPGYGTIQPEGATGCWGYFVINNIEGMSFPLPAQSAIRYHEFESDIRVTNIEIQTDAAGNKVIYASHRPERLLKHCYYFSARKDFPLRKITNKELFTAYKIHHEKRVNEQIIKFEKLVAGNDKSYNALSAKEKAEQPYWPEIIRKDKEYLQKYRAEKESILQWYQKALLQSNINELAYVTSVNGSLFEPENLQARAGEGFNAWVDNLSFYDNKLPKDQPQCIALYIRRQDQDLPKKNFMDIFTGQFNLDVLAKMTGEAPKKPGTINSLNASSGEAKTLTVTNQKTIGPVNMGFENSNAGQFPSGWLGMKNISLQKKENNNWLAMTKDGYWYPRQYNKEIKDGFSLSFNLEWPENISYYSGLFTVTISEIEYDNLSETYRMVENQRNYWSFYDGYAGEFNRVILWFDPHFNNGGSLDVYVYNNRETNLFSKRISLPGFFKDKNKHQLSIERKGNGLIVTDNGKTIADLPNLFQSTVRYNLFTFSRYKGNKSEDPNDLFYLNNVKASY